MDEAEVRCIAEYVESLEKGFGDWDYRYPLTHRELTKLHLTIERLSRKICETSDERLRPVLADLENRAQKCKKCVETRLAVHN